MTLTQLRYVVALDETRHFGRASKKCAVSQPSLSMQVQKLEDELGIIIFDRTKSPIVATDSGAQVLVQARAILKEASRMDEVISQSENVSGSFNLAVIPTIAPYVIPLFAAGFRNKYPEVSLNINEMKTEDIIDALESDRIDCGLLATPLYSDQIVERVLFYEPFYAYVDENCPLTKKKQLKDTDLDRDKLWILTEGHCFRQQILNVCKLEALDTKKNSVNFESGNIDTLIRLVDRTGGQTLLPQMAVDGLSKARREKCVRPFKSPAPTREVSLVYSRLFLKEKIIDALEREILDNLPKHIRSVKKDRVSVIDI